MSFTWDLNQLGYLSRGTRGPWVELSNQPLTPRRPSQYKLRRHWQVKRNINILTTCMSLIRKAHDLTSSNIPRWPKKWYQFSMPRTLEHYTKTSLNLTLWLFCWVTWNKFEVEKESVRVRLPSGKFHGRRDSSERASGSLMLTPLLSIPEPRPSSLRIITKNEWMTLHSVLQ